VMDGRSASDMQKDCNSLVSCVQII
jgi:hypothetical protein